MKNLLTVVLSFVYVLIYSQPHFEFGVIPLLGSTHLFTSNTEVCNAIEADYHISAHIEKLTYWEFASGGEGDPELATSGYLHLYKYDNAGNVIERKTHRLSLHSAQNTFKIVKVLKIDTTYHVYINRYGGGSFSSPIGSEIFIADTNLDRIAYPSIKINLSTRNMLADVVEANGAIYLVLNAYYNNDYHCHFIKTSYSYVNHWVYKLYEGFEFRKLAALNNRLYIVGNRGNNAKIIDFSLLTLTPSFTLYDYALPYVTDDFMIFSERAFGADIIKLVTSTNTSTEVFRYHFINPNTVGHYVLTNKVNMSFAGPLQTAFIANTYDDVFKDLSGFRVDLSIITTPTIKRYWYPFYQPLAVTVHPSGLREHYHSTTSGGYNYGYNINYKCTYDSTTSALSTINYGLVADYSPTVDLGVNGSYDSRPIEFTYKTREDLCAWPRNIIDPLVDKRTTDADISVSPNPFSRDFDVSIPGKLIGSGENEIVVYNLMGCVISKQAVNSDRVRFNLEGVDSGVYIVKFGNIIKKIIKN